MKSFIAKLTTGSEISGASLLGDSQKIVDIAVISDGKDKHPPKLRLKLESGDFIFIEFNKE